MMHCGLQLQNSKSMCLRTRLGKPLRTKLKMRCFTELSVALGPPWSGGTVLHINSLLISKSKEIWYGSVIETSRGSARSQRRTAVPGSTNRTCRSHSDHRLLRQSRNLSNSTEPSALSRFCINLSVNPRRLERLVNSQPESLHSRSIIRAQKSVQMGLVRWVVGLKLQQAVKYDAPCAFHAVLIV